MKVEKKMGCPVLLPRPYNSGRSEALYILYGASTGTLRRWRN